MLAVSVYRMLIMLAARRVPHVSGSLRNREQSQMIRKCIGPSLGVVRKRTTPLPQDDSRGI